MENKKRLRVIVWDCEKGKVLYDEQTDRFIGGADKEGNFRVIFVGEGNRLQKLDIIREMMRACRKLKRMVNTLRGEKESG